MTRVRLRRALHGLCPAALPIAPALVSMSARSDTFDRVTFQPPPGVRSVAADTVTFTLETAVGRRFKAQVGGA
jgi:hypothetical protein